MKGRSIITLLVIIMFTFVGICNIQAQYSEPYLYSSYFPQHISGNSYKQISIKGYLEQNSSAITNSLVNTVYFGEGIITGDLKSKTTNRTWNSNRIGLEASGEICLMLKSENTTLTYGGLPKESWTEFKVGTQVIGSANFRKDLWNIASSGNKQYEDETAIFDGSGGKIVGSSYLGFTRTIVPATPDPMRGWSDSKGGRPRVSVSFGATIHLVNTYQEAVMKQGSLYTAPYGEYLESSVNYSSSGSLTDTGTFKPGPGLTVNFAKEFVLGKDSSGVVVGKMYVQGLGFAYLSGLNQIEIDSNYTFGGVQIDNILNPDIQGFSDFTAATIIEELGGTSTTVNKLVLMPGIAGIRFRKSLSANTKLHVHISQRFIPGYLMKFTVTPEFRSTKKMQVYVPVSFGGFGTLNTGLGVKGKIVSDRLGISLLVPNLNSMILGNNWSGQGGILMMNYHF